MKNLMTPDIDVFRLKDRWIVDRYGSLGDEANGLFLIPSPYCKRDPLRVLASCGEGWEHLSVSKIKRAPTWSEMEYVKRLFFTDDEVAMQLHVPPDEHINLHSNCLHLWRPIGMEIPRPPEWMV